MFLFVKESNRTVGVHAICDRWPWARAYYNRSEAALVETGSVHVCSPSDARKDPTVVQMIAQYAPGRVRSRHLVLGVDPPRLRLVMFEMSLNALLEVRGVRTRGVAMPHGICCGVSGGQWSDYSLRITEWSARNQVPVVLYRLKPQNSSSSSSS